MLAIAVERREV